MRAYSSSCPQAEVVLGPEGLLDKGKSVWSEEVKRLVSAGKLKEGEAKSLVA